MTNDPHLLTGAYALDAVSDDERALVEAHLLACPECRTEVAELRATAASLVALTSTPPPARLRESVLDAARRTRQEPPVIAQSEVVAVCGASAGMPTGLPGATATDQVAVDGQDPDPAYRGASVVAPVRWRRWAAVAATAAAAITGVTVWQPWATPDTLAEQVVSAADAQRWTTPVSSGGNGRLTVVRSADLHHAAIVLAGMPPAPAGHDYQAWLATPQGAMVPAGVLPDPSDGTSTLVLTGDVLAATGVGLTVEPDGGSLQPTTQPVVLINLS